MKQTDIERIYTEMAYLIGVLAADGLVWTDAYQEALDKSAKAIAKEFVSKESVKDELY